MWDAATQRIRRVRTVVRRATAVPLLVRCLAGLSGASAVLVAYPQGVLTSRYLPLLLVLAALPGFAPRGRAGTFAAVVVVVGWVADTSWYDRPVALWRVVVLAALLYLAHTCAALAAVLPYDAVVRVDVVGRWLARAAAVVLASAVLAVVVSAVSLRVAGPAIEAATLAGLAAAVAVPLVLARLVGRD